MGDDPNRPRRAAAVLLAAGRSTRMGGENKLLKEIEPGIPVVRRAVERALASGLAPFYVVTGHEAGKVRDALAGLGCRFVHNPDYAQGLSGSIRTGFRRAVADGACGVLVLLGDMPFLPMASVEAVLAAAAGHPGKVVQAVHAGKPAHPVWLPAEAGDLLERLEGDRGVRSLLAQSGGGMIDVEVPDTATVDIDTPADFLAARRRAGAFKD
ncbi:MAG: NTP transferase domain-containing protein [Oricola sp.]